MKYVTIGEFKKFFSEHSFKKIKVKSFKLSSDFGNTADFEVSFKEVAVAPEFGMIKFSGAPGVSRFQLSCVSSIAELCFTESDGSRAFNVLCGLEDNPQMYTITAYM